MNESFNGLDKNDEGISPLAYQLTPLAVRQESSLRGHFARQRSTLMDQDNVVLANQKNPQMDSFGRDQKQGNGLSTGKQDDFTDAFMSMLNQEPKTDQRA